MKKKIQKNKDVQSVALTKKIPPEDMKKIIIKSFTRGIDSMSVLEELSSLQLSDFFKNQEQDKALANNFEKVALAFSLESGCILAESVPERYKSFCFELKKKLEQEFDCQTASEKAIVEQAVNAHIKTLSYSRLMNKHKEPEHLSPDKVNMLNFYSREIDRAHRQYISAIETLKFMKQPSLKVNIKTNNAFLAENQQFNSYKNQDNESK
ncbi:MAG: hypothetical protein HGA61_00675 [Candidatus Moranbacteria bacterium]|nr:hypothetical protein [Candidatus Moranbacteria bacterium]